VTPLFLEGGIVWGDA